MKRWEPEDIIGMILAVAVAGIVIRPVFKELQGDAIEPYEKVIIAVIAIISLYIGSKLKK